MLVALALLAPALEGTDPAFDVGRAHLFYELASSSYCSDAAITGWSCRPCRYSNVSAATAPTIFYDKGTGARGFVGAFGTAGDTVVLSFEGSEGLENWIENLKFAKTDKNMSCAGCKVHSGFYDCWKALKDAGMVRTLRELLATRPAASVYTTGHSLGAAIAMLAAYELQFEFKIAVHGVWTYGQPRVGNQAFHDFYNDASPRVTWRLTHWHDPVPHVPLESMGFSHIGTEVWYDEKWTSHRVCDGTGEDPKCSDSVSDIGINFSIDDHLTYFNERTGENGCGETVEQALA